MLFIDVPKAHLYAPTVEDSSAYVELPPECSKPGTCGKLNFLFMWYASRESRLGRIS